MASCRRLVIAAVSGTAVAAEGPIAIRPQITICPTCYPRSSVPPRYLDRLDSVGIGAMPDAAEYGDPPGADTLGNIARIRGLKLPNLARLGLGNIKPLAASRRPILPRAPMAAVLSPRRARTQPPATGKWWAFTWLAISALPARVPAGSHDRVRAAHRPQVSGQPGRLRHRNHQGPRARAHAPGSPIVYTSADSVFQVAAHEEVIPLRELYSICEPRVRFCAGRMRSGVSSRGVHRRAGQFHAHRQPSRLRRAAAQGHAARPSRERGVPVYGVGKISTCFWVAASGNPRRPKTTPTAWPRPSRP